MIHFIIKLNLIISLILNHQILQKLIEINSIKMKELYKKKDYHGLKLDGIVYDDRSQAVILNKGVPIISKLNNKTLVILITKDLKLIKLIHLQLLLKMALKN
jgi:hypothetical protein